ncbi:Protein CBFA2T1 [Bulinus truncatus]|nr:Protein CBFA2T1 [Bulinus truncatus]
MRMAKDDLLTGFRSTESLDHLERLDDDWRHVETMLNCIIGMVDKTKRAMSVLQERSIRDREELALWARRQADGIDADVKKRSGDVMAYTLRQTEERVSEVRRRAEEAVNDMKRQAMLELQKAVAAADQKAAELVSTERAKMERAITDARKQTHSDLLMTLSHQEESAESCWNCGRKASETCSGCNVARYCGSFCQHKDWENHHHVCGKAHITSVAEAREMRRAALVSAASAAIATSTSLSSASGKDMTSSSCKASSSTETSSASCVSPAPSVVPSLSTKDTTKSTAVISPPSPALKSPSPANHNPASPAQDAESRVSSAAEGSPA